MITGSVIKPILHVDHRVTGSVLKPILYVDYMDTGSVMKPYYMSITRSVVITILHGDH